VVVDGVHYEVLQDMKVIRDMKSAIHDFYKSLFTKFETWRPKVDGLFLTSIYDFDRDTIELPFTEEEVNKGLLGYCGDEAPNSNGITIMFLQSNCNTIKTDVMKLFFGFFSSRKFTTNLSSTFIGLISKKVNAENIRDFWPINLAGCI